MDYDWKIHFIDGGFTTCRDDELNDRLIKSKGNISKIVHK